MRVSPRIRIRMRVAYVCVCEETHTFTHTHIIFIHAVVCSCVDGKGGGSSFIVDTGEQGRELGASSSTRAVTRALTREFGLTSAID